jgi:LPXTG-motif cell wall-anchored protein
MPDTGDLILIVPAAVAVAIATAVGLWLKKRS